MRVMVRKFMPFASGFCHFVCVCVSGIDVAPSLSEGCVACAGVCVCVYVSFGGVGGKTP